MRDERGREVHERQVVPRFHFPSDQQRAKAIVPTVGALDDPAAGTPPHASDERGLALLPNMRRDAARAERRVARFYLIRPQLSSRVSPRQTSRPYRAACHSDREHPSSGSP